MTLGSKIQECRKALGLSQEELGQRLLVSRQTVSLWENDQTLPSIDNLTRLKDIFGISVDELLGVVTNSPDNRLPDISEDEPLEEYSSKITEKEWKEVFNAQTQYIRFFYLPLIYLIGLLIVIALDLSVWSTIALAALFICSCVISLVNYLKFQKRIDKTIHSTAQYRSVTKIYHEYLEEIVYKDGKFDNLNKFSFSKFSHAKDTGNLITAFCNNKIFAFRKSELKENSLIYSKLDIKDYTPKKRKMNLYSVLLFVLSLLSVLVSVLCAFYACAIFDLELPPFWISFLFLPISLFSVYFGFSAKRKLGKRYVKNIVAGIIASVMLLLSGFHTFVFNEFYRVNDTEKYIQSIQEYTGIAIPEYESFDSFGYGDEGARYDNCILYKCSYFGLRPDKSNNFEETLINDSRWIEKIPSELEDLILTDGEFTYHYLLMCNVDTGQINALPEKSGKYKIIVIFYDVQADKMLVLDYDVEYVK